MNTEGDAPETPKDPQKRSGRAEVRARVDEIYRLLVQKATFRDVAEYAREQGWGVSPSQLRRYQTLALKMIAHEGKRQRKGFFARHVATLNFAVGRAFQTGDIRTAHALLRDLAELHSAYPEKDNGGYSGEEMLEAVKSIDRVVSDLMGDDAAYGTFHREMLTILQSLQARKSRR